MVPNWMSAALLLLSVLIGNAEGRFGTCSFPDAWRNQWYYGKSGGRNLCKSFENYVIRTLSKSPGSVPGVGETTLQDEDCTSFYALDGKNFFNYIKAATDTATPSYCMYAFMSDVALLINEPGTPEDLSAADLCPEPTDPYRVVHIKYPFTFDGETVTQSQCPFTRLNKNGDTDNYQVSMANTDYNTRYCDGVAESIVSVDKTGMTFSMPTSCLPSGYTPSYQDPFEDNLLCVESFIIGADAGERAVGGNYVILAKKNGEDDFSFYCAVYKEDNDKVQIELSILAETPDKSRCNVEATAYTVDSSKVWRQFTLKPNQCDSGICVNGLCTQRLDGYTCECDSGWVGTKCDLPEDNCASSPCGQYGTCVNGINSYRCNCIDGYTGVNCLQQACLIPDEFRGDWWMNYTGSTYDVTTTQIATITETYIVVALNNFYDLYECEGWKQADRDPSFYVMSAFDSNTNNLRHCIEMKKSPDGSFMFLRKSDPEEKDSPIPVEECDAKLGEPDKFRIWVTHPFNSIVSNSDCPFPDGSYTTLISNSTNKDQCQGDPQFFTDFTVIENGHVSVFSCIDDDTYGMPFGDGVPLYCLGTFPVDAIDSNSQGEGVMVVYQNPVDNAEEAGGLSFYCGRWVQDGLSVKLSLYAESAWYTDCEVSKTPVDSDGDYISFVWDDVADPCSSDPCENGGTCENVVVNNAPDFKCTCLLGFTGKRCEINIPNCLPNPCYNGGTCSDRVGTYECYCPPGYTGTRCETEMCFMPEDWRNVQWWTGYSNGFRPTTITFEESSLKEPNTNLELVCEALATVNGDVYIAFKKSDDNKRLCVKITQKDRVMIYRETIPVTKPTKYLALECQRMFANGASEAPPGPEVFVQYPFVMGGGECDFTEITYQMKYKEMAFNPYACEGVLSSTGTINDGGYKFSFDSCYNGLVTYQRPFTNTVLQCVETFTAYQVDGKPSDRGDVVILAYEDAATPGKYTLYCARYKEDGKMLYLSLDVESSTRTRCDFDATYESADDINQLIVLTSDKCSSQPCQNGGTCDDYLNDYICNCMPGFTGYDCETNINECLSRPCLNGATCLDGINTFDCICRTGFSGVYCDNKDSCFNRPCLNGGTCTDLGTTFSCTCLPGWTGPICQTDIDECASGPCLNMGTCVDKFNAYECICPYGVSGVNCEMDQVECASQPCQHGGTCLDRVNGYYCRCPVQYIGVHCEHPYECWRNPCMNGGTCQDDLNFFTCQCPIGYLGELCEIEETPCHTVMCENGGQCVVSGQQGFYCHCQPGFYGYLCEKRQVSCLPNPCRNGGVCREFGTSFYCECPTGWVGSMCTEPITDPCSSMPCMNGGTCRGDGNEITCFCPTGFYGKYCQDGTERQCYPNPCLNQGQCRMQGSDYMCICQDGYTGRNCQDRLGGACYPNPCENGGRCTNWGLNDYRCVCEDKYSGRDCQNKKGLNTLAIILIVVGAVLLLAVLLAVCVICVRRGWGGGGASDDIIVVDGESDRGSSVAWYPEYYNKSGPLVLKT